MTIAENTVVPTISMDGSSKIHLHLHEPKAVSHYTVSCIKKFEFKKLSLKVWVFEFEFKMVWRKRDWKIVVISYSFDNITSPLDWHNSHSGCGRCNHLL